MKNPKKKTEQVLKIKGNFSDVLKVAVEGNPKPKKEKKKS